MELEKDEACSRRGLCLAASEFRCCGIPDRCTCSLTPVIVSSGYGLAVDG